MFGEKRKLKKAYDRAISENIGLIKENNELKDELKDLEDLVISKDHFGSLELPIKIITFIKKDDTLDIKKFKARLIAYLWH